MKKTRVIHKGWREGIDLENQCPGEFPLCKDMFGKWQYIYEEGKYWVSLIHINVGLIDKKKVWEVYSRETLFEGTPRFDTKKEAEIFIMEQFSKVKGVKNNG